jgi:hypothetical protein
LPHVTLVDRVSRALSHVKQRSMRTGALVCVYACRKLASEVTLDG